MPAGQDPDGVQVGFITASAPGASVAITITDAPPAPIPGAAVPNNVLQEDLTLGVGRWAMFVHNFTNDTVDAWVPQDWSSYVGFSLWLYGNNTEQKPILPGHPGQPQSRLHQQRCQALELGHPRQLLRLAVLPVYLG